MSTTQRAPISVAVLNVIQALAADSDLSAGLHNIISGNVSNLDLGIPIKVSDRIHVTKTAYAAGTLSVKYVDYGATTLAANTKYAITVMVPNAIVPGGSAPDPLLRQRTYTWFSGASAPTAAEVAIALVAAINADPQRRVNAAVTSTDRVTCTLIDLYDGDFELIQYNTGGVYATTTAYVAPSGTNVMVNAVAPGFGTEDDYITYKITWNKLFNNNTINGLKAFKEVDSYIFVSTAATNRAALITEIDAVYAGTHSPTADYL